MAFDHAPLDRARLPPTVAKLVDPQAPAKARQMAARGLAPLPPADLVTTLYAFWVGREPTLADDASQAIQGLPPTIVLTAIDDPHLLAGALDFLTRKFGQDEAILAKIIHHPRVDNHTLASIARTCPESICDLIATHETRWLECPAVVDALYQNPHCRMSVIQRVLELAVRQGMDLQLPNIDEIRQELDIQDQTEDRDEAFHSATERVRQDHAKVLEKIAQQTASDLAEAEWFDDGEDPNELELVLEGLDTSQSPTSTRETTRASGDRLGQITRLRPLEKIRLALLGTAFERSVLIRDQNKAVSLSAIKSPKVKDNEVIAYSANRALSPDVIRYIARRREWTKLYQVKLNLVLNPKTPMAAAMSFLGHLHAHDVRKVARSRNVPSALAQAAKRKSTQQR